MTSPANQPDSSQRLTFRCADTGMKCDWETSGETEDEILLKIELHARDQHNLIVECAKVRRSIKRAIE